MNVLFITIGSGTVASSRVRVLRLARELRLLGHNTRVIDRSRGWRTGAQLTRALARQWDTIVLQKVVPPAALVDILATRSQQLVFECDDAIHGGYPGEGQDRVERRLQRLDYLRRRVSLVTAPNGLLANELAGANGRTLVFPGPAPERHRADGSTGEGKVVLWLGSPASEDYLRVLGDVPARLAERGISVVAVGASKRSRQPGIKVVPWSPDTEDYWLGKAGVGIMPMTLSWWADRKSAYKVLEYLAGGMVPVVTECSAVRAVLRDDDVAVRVSDPADWYTKILTASMDWSPPPDNWAGYRVVEQWSIRRYAEAWVEAVHAT